MRDATSPTYAGNGGDRLLDRLFVAVALGGDDDDGVRASTIGGGEVRPVVRRSTPPAERLGQVGQGVRHRGAADDDQVRGREHRLDVDLQRPLALARDRDDRHAVRDRAAELLGRAEQEQPRLARPVMTRCASRMTTGSAQAPPIQPYSCPSR